MKVCLGDLIQNIYHDDRLERSISVHTVYVRTFGECKNAVTFQILMTDVLTVTMDLLW